MGNVVSKRVMCISKFPYVLHRAATRRVRATGRPYNSSPGSEHMSVVDVDMDDVSGGEHDHSDEEDEDEFSRSGAGRQRRAPHAQSNMCARRTGSCCRRAAAGLATSWR